MYIPQAQVSLAPLTAYHVGGAAQWLDQPHSVLELQQALAWAQERQIPVTVMGAGTNVLVSDRGIAGLVLNLRQLQGITWHEGTLSVGAGEALAKLALLSARRGWHGLEWAVGIPGSVGGAVFMNAGAHQWEIAQLITGVQVVDRAGQLHHLSARELNFGYRFSALQQQQDLIVVAADLKLQPRHEPQQLIQQLEAYNHHRRQTQPQGLPNCGSVFRNPASHAAGWLLERCQLKGYRLGGAEVAQQHANFILNYDHACAQDVWDLMKYMHDQVEEHWGIDLHAEVRIWGEFEPRAKNLVDPAALVL